MVVLGMNVVALCEVSINTGTIYAFSVYSKIGQSHGLNSIFGFLENKCIFAHDSAFFAHHVLFLQQWSFVSWVCLRWIEILLILLFFPSCGRWCCLVDSIKGLCAFLFHIRLWEPRTYASYSGMLLTKAENFGETFWGKISSSLKSKTFITCLKFSAFDDHGAKWYTFI